MLGILKAGGAYVPLDPAYPSERLAWMAEDAGLNLLVVEKSLAGSLPVLLGTLEVLVRRRRRAGGRERRPATRSPCRRSRSSPRTWPT